MDDSMDWEADGAAGGVASWPPYAPSPSSSTTPYWTASSTPQPRLPNAAPPDGPFASTTGYIALDTNVLIGQYAVVVALHARLIAAGASTCLLVGQQVMVELDGLSKSGDGALSSSARAAIGWLDAGARALRLGRGGRLRVESRAERADAATSTAEGVGMPARPDDAVLSSCLYFSRVARVALWTNDRNLALLAEASGIPTLVGRRVTLPRLLDAAGVPLDADEAMQVDGEILDESDDDEPPLYDRAAHNARVVAAAAAGQTSPPAPSQQDHVCGWAPRAQRPTAAQAWPSPSPPNGRHGARVHVAAPPSAPPPPGSLADAIAALPSARVPPALRAEIAAALAPAQALMDPDAVLPSGSRDVEYARALAARLAALDASNGSGDTPAPSEAASLRQRILARATASATTLATFLGPEPRRGERRLRPGEAADALTALGDDLGMLVPIDAARWAPLAARIRQLT